MKKIIALLAISILLMTGCTPADTVNQKIKEQAENFNVRRRFIALNTRTDEPLFILEGLISIKTDTNVGDINVTVKTGEDEYKLFYAHLSKDITYTVIQLEPTQKENPYSYDINFYPLKESILHGIFDATYEKPTSNTENSLELKE